MIWIFLNMRYTSGMALLLKSIENWGALFLGIAILQISLQ
jgi:hypothetical protein